VWVLRWRLRSHGRVNDFGHGGYGQVIVPLDILRGEIKGIVDDD